MRATSNNASNRIGQASRITIRSGLTAAAAPAGKKEQPNSAFIVAWVFCLVFHYFQYSLRLLTVARIPEHAKICRATHIWTNTTFVPYCYTSAGFTLMTTAALNRYGVRLPIFLGVRTAEAGCVLFGLGSIGPAA